MDQFSVGGAGYVRVGDAIRECIIHGVYPPGSRLKVQELCAQFGISSNPIREALQQLQGEGLVVISPNRGATVRVFDEELIRHVYDIGAGVDGILARRCASVASPAQVDHLRGIQRQLEAVETALRGTLNGEFHAELARISGNTEALEIRRKHHNLIGGIREKYGHSSPARFMQVNKEHWSIIDAIAAGDENAAEQAARYHCLQSCEDLVGLYRSFDAE
ncbi:GntR family transcriptional regulator [Devosia sp. A449]